MNIFILVYLDNILIFGFCQLLLTIYLKLKPNKDFNYLYVQNNRSSITKSVNKDLKTNKKAQSNEFSDDINEASDRNIWDLSGPKKLNKANIFQSRLFCLQKQISCLTSSETEYKT